MGEDILDEICSTVFVTDDSFRDKSKYQTGADFESQIVPLDVYALPGRIWDGDAFSRICSKINGRYIQTKKRFATTTHTDERIPPVPGATADEEEREFKRRREFPTAIDSPADSFDEIQLEDIQLNRNFATDADLQTHVDGHFHESPNKGHIEDAREEDYGNVANLPYPQYSNPFDPRLSFKGLHTEIDGWRLITSTGKRPYSTINANSFLNLADAAGFTDAHLNAYRDYLRQLSADDIRLVDPVARSQVSPIFPEGLLSPINDVDNTSDEYSLMLEKIKATKKLWYPEYQQVIEKDVRDTTRHHQTKFTPGGWSTEAMTDTDDWVNVNNRHILDTPSEPTRNYAEATKQSVSSPKGETVTSKHDGINTDKALAPAGKMSRTGTDCRYIVHTTYARTEDSTKPHAPQIATNELKKFSTIDDNKPFDFYLKTLLEHTDANWNVHMTAEGTYDGNGKLVENSHYIPTDVEGDDKPPAAGKFATTEYACTNQGTADKTFDQGIRPERVNERDCKDVPKGLDVSTQPFVPGLPYRDNTAKSQPQVTDNVPPGFQINPLVDNPHVPASNKTSMFWAHQQRQQQQQVQKQQKHQPGNKKLPLLPLLDPALRHLVQPQHQTQQYTQPPSQNAPHTQQPTHTPQVPHSYQAPPQHQMNHLQQHQPPQNPAVLLTQPNPVLRREQQQIHYYPNNQQQQQPQQPQNVKPPQPSNQNHHSNQQTAFYDHLGYSQHLTRPPWFNNNSIADSNFHANNSVNTCSLQPISEFHEPQTSFTQLGNDFTNTASGNRNSVIYENNSDVIFGSNTAPTHSNLFNANVNLQPQPMHPGDRKICVLNNVDPVVQNTNLTILPPPCHLLGSAELAMNPLVRPALLNTRVNKSLLIQPNANNNADVDVDSVCDSDGGSQTDTTSSDDEEITSHHIEVIDKERRAKTKRPRQMPSSLVHVI